MAARALTAAEVDSARSATGPADELQRAQQLLHHSIIELKSPRVGLTKALSCVATNLEGFDNCLTQDKPHSSSSCKHP